MKRRILVVEDDASLARVLCDNLAYEGFDVALSADGENALKNVQERQPDLVLLDITLPGMNGLEVCRRLTRQRTGVAVIMLTARNQQEDKVQGFRTGADDYVSKPFALDELLARIHAVLRRMHPTIDRLVLGDLTFDFIKYNATRGNAPAQFSQR